VSNKKALVLFSGGQDSTTCLYWAKEKFKEVRTLSIQYGQRHSAEIKAAEFICGLAGVQRTVINLESLFQPIADSALLHAGNISVPHRSGGLPSSFVPGRNIILLTVAAMVAFKHGIKHIVTGVCQTDYSGYPDCRDDTIKSLQTTLNLGMFDGEGENSFIIHTPLMRLTKAETIQTANKLPGCFDALAYSHTCYEGTQLPCGKCPACVLREKGFEEAGKIDPLIKRLNEK